MSWQDTVMSDERLGIIYLPAEDYRWGDSSDRREYKEKNARRAIVKAQAKISFKAGYEQREKDPLDKEDRCDMSYRQGMRKVVELVNDFHFIEEADYLRWQALLKHFGLEKNEQDKD